MAKKLLGVQQLDMYERMINKEFEPIIDVLEARGNSIRTNVVQTVKKKFGLYDLEAKIRVVEIQLKELRGEEESLVGDIHHYSNVGDFRPDSIVGKEVTRMMNDLNHPLAEVTDKRDKTIKQLRLSGLPDEIQQVFTDLDETVIKLMHDIRKLPAITPRQIKGKK